jgi:hypothetical protein
MCNMWGIMGKVNSPVILDDPRSKHMHASRSQGAKERARWSNCNGTLIKIPELNNLNNIFKNKYVQMMLETRTLTRTQKVV